MLIEGVHFDPTYTPLKHLGYKSVVVNISDICAMNGQATHILVSLGIPNKYSIEHMEDLYEGIKLACKNYNIVTLYNPKFGVSFSVKFFAVL